MRKAIPYLAPHVVPNSPFSNPPEMISSLSSKSNPSRPATSLESDLVHKLTSSFEGDVLTNQLLSGGPATILAGLIAPFPIKDFFKHYWGKKVLAVKGSKRQESEAGHKDRSFDKGTAKNFKHLYSLRRFMQKLGRTEAKVNSFMRSKCQDLKLIERIKNAKKKFKEAHKKWECLSMELHSIELERDSIKMEYMAQCDSILKNFIREQETNEFQGTLKPRSKANKTQNQKRLSSGRKSVSAKEITLDDVPAEFFAKAKRDCEAKMQVLEDRCAVLTKPYRLIGMQLAHYSQLANQLIDKYNGRKAEQKHAGESEEAIPECFEYGKQIQVFAPHKDEIGAPVDLAPNKNPTAFGAPRAILRALRAYGWAKFATDRRIDRLGNFDFENSTESSKDRKLNNAVEDGDDLFRPNLILSNADLDELALTDDELNEEIDEWSKEDADEDFSQDEFDEDAYEFEDQETFEDAFGEDEDEDEDFVYDPEEEEEEEENNYEEFYSSSMRDETPDSNSECSQTDDESEMESSSATNQYIPDDFDASENLSTKLPKKVLDFAPSQLEEFCLSQMQNKRSSKKLVTAEEIEKFIWGGCSINVANPHAHSVALWRLVYALEVLTGCQIESSCQITSHPVNMPSYLESIACKTRDEEEEEKSLIELHELRGKHKVKTPGADQIILQTEGSSIWRIYKKSQPSSSGCIGSECDQCLVETVLAEEGDILYIPDGHSYTIQPMPLPELLENGENARKSIELAAKKAADDLPSASTSLLGVVPGQASVHICLFLHTNELSWLQLLHKTCDKALERLSAKVPEVNTRLPLHYSSFLGSLREKDADSLTLSLDSLPRFSSAEDEVSNESSDDEGHGSEEEEEDGDKALMSLIGKKCKTEDALSRLAAEAGLGALVPSHLVDDEAGLYNGFYLQYGDVDPSLRSNVRRYRQIETLSKGKALLRELFNLTNLHEGAEALVEIAFESRLPPPPNNEIEDEDEVEERIKKEKEEELLSKMIEERHSFAKSQKKIKALHMKVFNQLQGLESEEDDYEVDEAEESQSSSLEEDDENEDEDEDECEGEDEDEDTSEHNVETSGVLYHTLANPQCTQEHFEAVAGRLSLESAVRLKNAHLLRVLIVQNSSNEDIGCQNNEDGMPIENEEQSEDDDNEDEDEDENEDEDDDDEIGHPEVKGERVRQGLLDEPVSFVCIQTIDRNMKPEERVAEDEDDTNILEVVNKRVKESELTELNLYDETAEVDRESYQEQEPDGNDSSGDSDDSDGSGGSGGSDEDGFEKMKKEWLTKKTVILPQSILPLLRELLDNYPNFTRARALELDWFILSTQQQSFEAEVPFRPEQHDMNDGSDEDEDEDVDEFEYSDDSKDQDEDTDVDVSPELRKMMKQRQIEEESQDLLDELKGPGALSEGIKQWYLRCALATLYAYGLIEVVIDGDIVLPSSSKEQLLLDEYKSDFSFVDVGGSGPLTHKMAGRQVAEAYKPSQADMFTLDVFDAFDDYDDEEDEEDDEDDEDYEEDYEGFEFEDEDEIDLEEMSENYDSEPTHNKLFGKRRRTSASNLESKRVRRIPPSLSFNNLEDHNLEESEDQDLSEEDEDNGVYSALIGRALERAAEAAARVATSNSVNHLPSGKKSFQKAIERAAAAAANATLRESDVVESLPSDSKSFRKAIKAAAEAASRAVSSDAVSSLPNSKVAREKALRAALSAAEKVAEDEKIVVASLPVNDRSAVKRALRSAMKGAIKSMKNSTVTPNELPLNERSIAKALQAASEAAEASAPAKVSSLPKDKKSVKKAFNAALEAASQFASPEEQLRSIPQKREAYKKSIRATLEAALNASCDEDMFDTSRSSEKETGLKKRVKSCSDSAKAKKGVSKKDFEKDYVIVEGDYEDDEEPLHSIPVTKASLKRAYKAASRAAQSATGFPVVTHLPQARVNIARALDNAEHAAELWVSSNSDEGIPIIEFEFDAKTVADAKRLAAVSVLSSDEELSD